ncbi:disks large-associated protein 5 isoform 2-T2 [Thomomys bottae]
MSSSRFAGCHRKDLSTDMIRTKIAHRKSISQKENRHKEYERNRHFGLKDVNIPSLGGRVLANIDETAQDLVPETNIKTRSMKTIQSDERRQMLQKYKEEKQLKKLKEQREKAKQGVFKAGLYRPDAPCFLLTTQNALKAEGKKAIPDNIRITRSKAKDQMGQTKISNGSDAGPIRPGQRQNSEKTVLEKQKKAVQPSLSMPMRVTRSATQVTKQVAKTVSSTTTRKPVTRAATDKEPERKAPNKGRPAKKMETKPDKVISFKVESEENASDSQISATNVMDPDEGVLPEMENLPKKDGVLPEIENLPKTYQAKTRGKNSFAPQDFVFQPLDGLKTYQVTPMTPRSASAFLTPSYTWNPLKPEGDNQTEEARDEILTHQCTKTVQQDLKKLQCPLSSLPIREEEHDLSQNEATIENSNCLPIKGTPSPEITEGQVSQPQHDVPYFRHILQSETGKLTALCLEWDKKLELDIPDDAKDLIRTAVCQTRLLMKERFKQFEGLVNDCEYKRGEKETTCRDLDGFWDMVTFQVEDVNQKLNNLAKLEESGWQNNNSNPSRKVIRKKIVSGIANKSKQDDGGRAAARNRLAAIKNAMRERMKQGEQHADTVASVAPKEVDKIVFDAGFFRVESPVKSFSVLSSERCAQRLGTPKSAGKTVPENRTEMDLLGQKPSPENLHTQRECPGKKTLFSNVSESRDTVEDAQCSESQDVIEVSHGQDINEVNFEIYCVPSERMSLPPLSGVADDATANKEASDVVEEMELNSSVASQDVLMSSPEKNVPLQNTILKGAETSQSVLCDNKSLTTECHLHDSPGLNFGNLGTQLENRCQERARHISFGGNLIAFSPLRPLSGE